MPSLTALLGFAFASFLLIVVPGPSVLFSIARSLTIGRRGGLVTVLGNTMGQVPLIVAVAVGIGAIVAKSLVLFTVIKLLGAAYLIYLGIQAIRHRRVGTTTEAATPLPAQSYRSIFWEGFVVGVTNPKSIVFFLAVLPQFVDSRAGSVPLQMMLLGGVFIVIAMISDSVWVLLAGSARDWFARSPTRISALRTAGGVVMIGLGATLALAGNKN